MPGAVADAIDVANWLVELAGVQVRRITSTGTDAQTWTVADRRPNTSDVEQAFDHFLLGGGSEVARRLYVYMAGHGLAPEPRSRCLILADALGTIRVPNLEAPAWIDWFSNQYHFNELVLWMDCCATQTFDYSRGRPALPNTIARTGDPARVFMAFGSGVGRAAYEGPIGPGGAVRGLFTDRLLRGLKGGAADAAGEVRSASLVKFLYNGSDSTEEGPRPKDQPDPMIPQADDMLFAKAELPYYSLPARADDGSMLQDGTELRLLDGFLDLFKKGKVANGRVRFRFELAYTSSSVQV